MHAYTQSRIYIDNNMNILPILLPLHMKRLVGNQFYMVRVVFVRQILLDQDFRQVNSIHQSDKNQNDDIHME